MQILTDLQRAPAVKFNELQTAVNTPVIEDNPLDFDMRIDFFRQSDERVITAFTMQAENKDLSFTDIGGVQTARMNIFGKITHVSGKRAGIFEDPVSATATNTELIDAKGRKSAYQKAVALPSGRYKVDVIVRDVTSGATGVKHLGFEVPKYDAAKLSQLNAGSRGKVAKFIGSTGGWPVRDRQQQSDPERRRYLQERRARWGLHANLQCGR
ncbi:MAG: hypothetical protein WKF84_29215 [Pyrinomonadaceae bacterium]